MKSDDDGTIGPKTVHQRLLAAYEETQQGRDQPSLRARALSAIRDGRFDLADRLLQDEGLTLEGLIENLRIYQAELEIQNEELRKSQAQTETALARFKALFDSSPVAQLVLDHHGLIVEANPEARDLLQLRDTRSHQYFLARLLHSNDRGRILRAWEHLTENQATEVRETRLQPTDGISLFADVHIARLPAEQGGQPRFVCAIIDRTAAVRQREALRVAYDRLESSEERYRVLAEFSPEWDYWLGTDGRFIHVSPACYETTGYGSTDFINDPDLLERIMHADDLSVWRQHLADPLEQDRDHAPLVFRIRTRDGCERWIEHVCGPVIAGDGRNLGRRGVNRDITARRAIEDALRRSEALLNATGHLARVGGWELDIDGANLRWTAITRVLHEVDDDYQPDMATALDFYHPDDRKTLGQAIKRACGEGVGYELELRLRTAKGRELWVKTNGVAVWDDIGNRALRGSIQDITGRVEAERAQRESDARFRSVFDSAPLAIAVMDREGRTVMANAALEQFLGYSGIELAAMRCAEYTHPDYIDADQVLYRELLRGQGNSYTRDRRYLRKDGEVVWGRLTIALVQEANNEPIYAIGMIADIGEQLAAEKREIQARTVFENTSEGIIITDPEQRILAVNRAFSEITGFTEPEVLGKQPSMLRSGRQENSFYQGLWATLKATGQWRGEFWNRRKNGEVYPQLSTISAVYDQDQQLTNYISVFRDITQRKQSEEALYDLAHKDALTGLPNRSLLRARLEQSLSRAKREGELLALLFLDLDLFKNVNDTLGHPVGDALLQRVAEAMATKIRDADSIARLGGDEFVVLMEDLADPNMAAQLARRLLETFTEPFEAQGRELYITASIGISVFPMDGEGMDTLLSNADVAMYQAKEHGRNTYRFFEAAMTEGAIERLRLENALRGALARDELTLYYQPQVRIDNGQMLGAEALLRWTHPQLGQIPPGQFIPIAEELGIINELGTWVLEQACLQLVHWDQQGFYVPRIAVNLSVQQLERVDLDKRVREVLEQLKLDPGRLELEVTESMLMRHAERVIANLASLRDLGIAIAVDDFGSGYSSMAYLKQLPISRLKVDRAFVAHLTIDPSDDAITRAVIALGNGLGLDVLAEGVETQAQADFLLNEGCNTAQGYLFGRPMSAEDLERSGLGQIAP